MHALSLRRGTFVNAGPHRSPVPSCENRVRAPSTARGLRIGGHDRDLGLVRRRRARRRVMVRGEEVREVRLLERVRRSARRVRPVRDQRHRPGGRGRRASTMPSQIRGLPYFQGSARCSSRTRSDACGPGTSSTLPVEEQPWLRCRSRSVAHPLETARRLTTRRTARELVAAREQRLGPAAG